MTEALPANSYPSGAMLSVGLEPIGVGYKASIITTAGVGKVEYLTDSSWGTAEQTLPDILKEAGITSSDYKPVAPSGLEFKHWAKVNPTSGEITKIEESSYDTETYESGTSFVAVYTGNYSVNTGASNNPSLPVQIIAPNTGATLKDILMKAGATVSDGNITNPTKSDNVFGGWKVTLPNSEEILVSSDQINKGIGSAVGTFPPGTSIEPKWVPSSAYGDGGAAGGMPLTNLSSPAIGDGVTDEGTIIAKGDITKDNSGKILGYVYEVDKAQKIVLVVAKDVIQGGTAESPSPIRAWSKDNSASYNGYTGDSAAQDESNALHKAIGNITDGYSAWVKIRNWNPSAQYMNYPAIKTALVYPKKHKDNTYINKDNNSEVDAFVNGADVNSRWYLPTVAELNLIFAARKDLLNWTKDSHKTVGETTWLSGKTFWSVNVSDEKASNGKYTKAKCVTLSDSSVSESTADKLGNYYIIPVRQFKYE